MPRTVLKPPARCQYLVLCTCSDARAVGRGGPVPRRIVLHPSSLYEVAIFSTGGHESNPSHASHRTEAASSMSASNAMHTFRYKSSGSGRPNPSPHCPASCAYVQQCQQWNLCTLRMSTHTQVSLNVTLRPNLRFDMLLAYCITAFSSTVCGHAIIQQLRPSLLIYGAVSDSTRGNGQHVRD